MPYIIAKENCSKPINNVGDALSEALDFLREDDPNAGKKYRLTKVEWYYGTWRVLFYTDEMAVPIEVRVGGPGDCE